MRQARWAKAVALLLALGLIGCKPTDASWPFGPKAGSETGCEVLDAIATDKLAPLAAGSPTDLYPKDPTYEQRARDILGRLQPRSSTPADADAEIRIAGRSSLSFTAHSFTAFREKGAWTVSQVDTEAHHGGDSDDGQGRLIKRSFQLNSAAAGRLNAVLAGGCLWKTPVVLDDIPLQNGADGGVCLDGGTTYYDIRASGRRWRGVQHCGIYGAPGEILTTFSQAIDPRWRRTDDRRVVGMNRTEGPSRYLLPMPLGLLQYAVILIWGGALVLAVRRYRWRGLWVLAAFPLVFVAWGLVMGAVQQVYWYWAGLRG